MTSTALYADWLLGTFATRDIRVSFAVCFAHVGCLAETFATNTAGEFGNVAPTPALGRDKSGPYKGVMLQVGNSPTVFATAGTMGFALIFFSVCLVRDMGHGDIET